MVNGVRSDALTVPASYGAHRFWRNTSVATLANDQVATSPPVRLAMSGMHVRKTVGSHRD